MTRLKYTDLVYLLNILKLQAAKKSESLAQPCEEWTADLELALSIVQSTSGLIMADKSQKSALARMQAQELVSMITGGWKQESFKFQHFLGPLVLVNCGYGVDSAMSVGAYHLWENDLRACFEQFEKHFVSNAQAFYDFVLSLQLFLLNALKLTKSDNGLQCLKVLTLDWANTNAPELISDLLSFFENQQATRIPLPKQKPA